MSKDKSKPPFQKPKTKSEREKLANAQWTVIKAEECQVMATVYIGDDKNNGVQRVELRHYSFNAAKWFFLSRRGKLVRVEGDKKYVINGILTIPT